MSALADRSARTARAAGASTPAEVRRPVLQVVSAPAPSRSLVPYVLLLVAILLGSMVAALVINTSMAQTSFEIQARQVELKQLEQREASLRADVETAGSPAGLQAAAPELGMVPAENLGHISLSQGVVLESHGQ